MKKIIVLVIIIAVAAGLAYFYFHQKNMSSDNTLKVSGNIEATEIRLSFQTPGKIAERLVD